MSSVFSRAVLAMAAAMAMASAAVAQTRPYIGYVYPAGGQQGTKFLVKFGGQNVDGADEVIVTGKGISGKVINYLRKLGPQDTTLLREQLDALKKRVPAKAWTALMEATDDNDATSDSDFGMLSDEMMSRMSSGGRGKKGAQVDPKSLGIDPNIVDMVIRIRTRFAEYVLRPASAAIATLVVAEITIAPDAEPGRHEIRVVGSRGASNPLVFYVGQSKEFSRQPMVTSEIQVLGKEGLALRRLRNDGDVEHRVTIPCTMNGQIGSGQIHRYRFKARQSQGLVISAAGRELVPFIGDAVPGWFQPVLALYDADGKEVAYNDDYRSSPDPLILFKPPHDGEYVLVITDAIFRGREDFVYRITVDERPFVTSIFPLGAQIGTSPLVDIRGWNVDMARLDLPSAKAEPGIHILKAVQGKRKSNCIPFDLDTLPDVMDEEPNNDPAHAQKVEFPCVVNGRIDRPDDWDVFQISGHRGDTIVAEVLARRLNSPLDSVLKVTDSHGALVAINDDSYDMEGGTNTHFADSYVMFKVPQDGTYYFHLGDTARNGGQEYAYRLRISNPRPDFALRVAPSRVSLKPGGGDTVSVYIDRKDGFSDPVRVTLKDPPEGISCGSLTIDGKTMVGNLSIRANSSVKPSVADLVVVGRSQTDSREITHEAVASEDRMQAFLWRHLVPAESLVLCVSDPSDSRRQRRKAPVVAASADSKGAKPKFSRESVAGRLQMLGRLYDEGLLTSEFYREKVAEAGGSQ